MSVVDLLTERAPRSRLDRIEASVGDCDPCGLDVQLTLFVCYELHYRGFAGVDPEWEWNPGLLHLRARLENAFLTGIRRDVGDLDSNAGDEMERLSAAADGDNGPTRHLRSHGSWHQLREYLVHRSLDHLSGPDPHAWASLRLRTPRLTGRSATAVAVESHDFGTRCGGHLYQQMFTDLMVAARLEPGYLAYIDVVPAEALAVVNLMSLFGLHRSYRGAAVGHFTANAITSGTDSRRLFEALERMNAPGPCRWFYRQQAEADAARERVVRADVIGDLLGREPDLEPDVVFGMRAFSVVEDRLSAHLMRCWSVGDSSLRRPLN